MTSVPWHDAAVSEHARLFVDANASYEEGGQLDTRILGLPIIPPPVPGGTVTPPILIPPSGDFLAGRGIYFSFHLRTFSKAGIIYMSSSCTFQCEF